MSNDHFYKNTLNQICEDFILFIDNVSMILDCCRGFVLVGRKCYKAMLVRDCTGIQCYRLMFYNIQNSKPSL